MKVFSPFLNGNTTTSGSFNVPNHPSTASIQNPLTGSLFHDDTDGILKIYTGTQWQVVGEQALPVAGPASANIEYLLVAGGGGAGSTHGGAGGAGGYLSSSLVSVTSGSTFTITVGGGGAGTAWNTLTGVSGVDSSIAGATISTITSVGGGGGGQGYQSPSIGVDGGSGGGGGANTTNGSTLAGGSNTSGQGFSGGAGYGGGINTAAAGGGGGSGAAGGNGSAGSGGNGGVGKSSSISGTPTYYGGGGGAGSDQGTAGSAGTGGGGNGASNGNGSSGTNNTGGGAGGGGGGYGNGGSGGSGVAIFAYESGSFNAAGGIVGDAGNGRKYNQFNSSGTLKVGSSSDFGIVTDSLVAHYDAGNFASRGTSTWTDLQENYNISVNGPTLTDVHYYDLDGVNDYFNTTLGSIATNFTGETWQKFDTISRATTAEYVMQFGSLGVGTGLVLARFGSSYNGGSENNKMYIHRGSDFVTSTNLLNNTDWHHFVLVANGTNAILYVDTVEWLNISITSTTTNNVFEMGRHTDGNSLYADSKIGMARVYTKALTALEITQNYNATKTNFI